MRILKPGLSFFLISHFFISTFAQTPESILDSVTEGRKPEKLFTHFDKQFYQPGETIWFKTYLSVDSRPGIFSTVAKAELINEAGKIITSQIIPVYLGSATGSLSIPADLIYGTYVFRLYTQHMLNTDTEDFYYKPIPVIPSANFFDNAMPTTNILLRFFPEGGTFLTDELNILAFTATDQQGKPFPISGTIKDNKGNDVMSFTTEYNGMGKIEITPKKGEQYFAHYSLPSGELRNIQLPVSVDNGTNLLVIDEVLKKRLIINNKFAGNAQQKPAYVLGEMDQVVIFKIDMSKISGSFMARVPVKDLPGGLLHIAVFNADNKVLAERTCFVNSRNDTIEAVLTPVITSPGKRNENHFDFMLPDSLEGSFSVSVTDIEQTQFLAPDDNIISATLVLNNLKPVANNFLYQPGQLTGEEKNDALDLLLLTNEYKWNWEALKKLSTVKLPASTDNFIPLRGNAFSGTNKKLMPDAELVFILQTKDSAINSFIVKTDNDSYFETPGLFYEDTASIYVKKNKESSKDTRAELKILSPSLPETYNLPVHADKIAELIPLFLKVNDELKYKPTIPNQPIIDFDTTYKVLEELVLTSKVKSPEQLLEKRYTKGLFSGSARTTIDFINNKPTYLGGNIFNYLNGRYPYIRVMGNSPNYSLVYRNMFSLGSGTFVQMTLYLDEMPVDASTLTTIPMSDIALVKIYTSGILGTGGALAVYTKRGEDASGSNNLLVNMNKYEIHGFSKTKLFYSPDYKTMNKTAVKNDNRKTLYWNPSLTFIPEDGKVPVSFYNTDQCKGYKIVVQGLTTNGKLVYIEKLIR